MTHELLWNVLDTQRVNATLAGRDLRASAEELLRLHTLGRPILMAFDAAGQRIVGAAMTLTDQPVEVFDYTAPFPKHATCLLVGGAIAGPVGVADAAAVVTGAGATRVEAAVIGGWPTPIDGVSCILDLGW